MAVCTLIPVLGKQAELCEIQTSLASVLSSSPARATNRDLFLKKEKKTRTKLMVWKKPRVYCCKGNISQDFLGI